MNDRTDFSDVRRRLQPGDVFHRANHDWKTQSDHRWKGSCPWHDSSSGTCFTVNPETLEWYCFSCKRGGGPLEYVAELENVGSGAHGSLKGQDFFRAWEALSRHAGCNGPPDNDSGSDRKDGSRKSSDRRPLRNSTPRKEARGPRRVESASTNPKGGPSPPPRGQPEPDTGRKMKHSEEGLRKAVLQYRDALKESDKARAYVEGRGLSVETLYAHGCGYAAPGEWLDDDIKKDGRYIHRAPNGRIVTPHTTPGGRLVCLSGRAVEPCPDWLRKRHLDGHSPALFNALAIEGEPSGTSGPLVLCEGPFDALSFIEAGWKRTAALHNTDGVPWDALRGSVSALVFAFDRDDTGRENALKRAREAIRCAFDAYTLHDEAAYQGHSDNPMEGGDLKQPHGAGGSSDSGRAGSNPENNPMTGGKNAVSAGPTERPERPANGSGTDQGQPPTPEPNGEEDGAQGYTAADLVGYWNGDNIGHLGRWLWERGGVPEGEVGAGLYADRELHEWIEEALQAGPGGTTDRERDRLHRVLWRLYATHGPETVREEVVEHLATPSDETPTEAEHSPETADVWDERPRDPYRLGRLPPTVETTRTAAPTDNPHPGQRGIAIDSPYSAEFVHDLKVLPEWARTWNGDAWVVDDRFAAFAGDLCRHYFG